MKRLLPILLLSMLFVVPSVRAAEIGVLFAAKECSFTLPPRQMVECGDLLVSEDDTALNSPDVRVSVVILRQENPEPDPIIYIEGGPGGSALEQMPAAYASRYRPLLATNRDIIIFDPRGIGESTPTLDCPMYDTLSLDALDFEIAGEQLTREQIESRGLQALRDCGEALAAQADLNQYDSARVAADIESLRIALGYEQVNLWGISYGTRIALTMMRDYPDSVRSVVLDSVVPPDIMFFETIPAHWTRSLNALFDACAADVACEDTYPHLDEIFFATVTILNQNPATFDLTNPLTGETYRDVVFDGNMFLEMSVQMMYNTSFVPMMPQLIYQVHSGRYGIYSALMASIIAQENIISYGAYFATHCREEIPFNSLAAIQESFSNHPELNDSGAIVQQIFDICDSFNITPSLTIENDAVSSAIPALLFGGHFDPITPPSSTKHAAMTLSNSQYIELPYSSHGATSSEDCPQELAVAFFVNPAAAVDESCVADMSWGFRGAQANQDSQANVAEVEQW